VSRECSHDVSERLTCMLFVQSTRLVHEHTYSLSILSTVIKIQLHHVYALNEQTTNLVDAPAVSMSSLQQTERTTLTVQQ